MRPRYTAETYDLITNNCNNFSDDVCQFLVGKCVPEAITGLPQRVFSTPLGAMLRPMIEAMLVIHKNDCDNTDEKKVVEDFVRSIDAAITPLTEIGAAVKLLSPSAASTTELDSSTENRQGVTSLLERPVFDLASCAATAAVSATSTPPEAVAPLHFSGKRKGDEAGSGEDVTHTKARVENEVTRGD
jgi:hypothetical protein